jgi:hypothetical protein
MPGDVEELREPQHDSRAPAPVRRPTSTLAAPIGGAGIASDGSSSASSALERAIDRAPQRRARVHRAHVVLREHVASHLEPQAHAGEYCAA